MSVKMGFIYEMFVLLSEFKRFMVAIKSSDLTT